MAFAAAAIDLAAAEALLAVQAWAHELQACDSALLPTLFLAFTVFDPLTSVPPADTEPEVEVEPWREDAAAKEPGLAATAPSTAEAVTKPTTTTAEEARECLLCQLKRAAFKSGGFPSYVSALGWSLSAPRRISPAGRSSKEPGPDARSLVGHTGCLNTTNIGALPAEL